jgi:hypothetical protein
MAHSYRNNIFLKSGVEAKTAFLYVLQQHASYHQASSCPEFAEGEYGIGL